MKHQVAGKWYCETRDVEGVNQNTLLTILKRSNGSQWCSIPSPHFNNRNSRRLILIESIPDAEVRQKVLSKLQLSLDHHEGALLVAEKAGLGTVSRTATEATSQTPRMITYARTAAFAYFVFEQLRDIHSIN